MTTVLLLNASYEPLSVIPTRRALSLWMRGRVDGATEVVTTMKGVTADIEIPTVIRLRRYIQVPRRGARWSRYGIFKRDGYTCIYCGLTIGNKSKGRALIKTDFTIDHIVPRSKGGKNTWGNTACSCGKCNNRKADRSPHQAGMKLRWEPKTPRVDYLVAVGSIPDEWKVFLQV